MIQSITKIFTSFSWNRSIVLGFGKALSISVINQAVVSSTNFLLGLYLVRVLSPKEFGFYGIGLTVVLLYLGVGNALFLTQMVVRIPDKTPDKRKKYAARMLVATVIFATTTGSFAAGSLIVWGGWSAWSSPYIYLIGAIAGAATGALLKEYFVRQAYSARREARALKTNISVSIVIVALLGYCHFYGNIHAGWQVLWIYASGQFVGAAVGLFFAKLPCRGLSLKAVFNDVNEAFTGGRWALGGVTVTWAQSQAYTYVTALSLGAAGVGYANAARLLIAPLMFLMPALNQLTIPRLAELRVKERRSMMNIGFYITIGLLIIAMIYSSILLCFSDIFASLLLGDKYHSYPGIMTLVVVWCLVMHMQMLRSGAANLLQALKRFRALMMANVLSAAAAVIGAIALSELFGIPGAILGTGIGELCLAALLWRVLWLERKKTN